MITSISSALQLLFSCLWASTTRAMILFFYVDTLEFILWASKCLFIVISFSAICFHTITREFGVFFYFLNFLFACISG